VKTASVIGVVSTGFVNVTCAGAAIPNVPYPSWYAPQSGDVVILDYVGQQPIILTCLTPGRTVANLVNVVNSAPGGGWDQISTVYSQSGVSTNPQLTLVRTTTPTSPNVVTATPIGSRTWSPDWPSWRSDTDKVRQGSYGSGENYGLWFYGSSAFSGLSGHTVTGVTMSVVRDTNSGTSWGPMQLHMHGYTTQPGSGPPTIALGPNDAAGANPSLGQTVTFALPVSWGQALQAGTYAGVGIASPDSVDSLVLVGASGSPLSGQLKITYV
jgi:hypothetical protein